METLLDALRDIAQVNHCILSDIGINNASINIYNLYKRMRWHSSRPQFFFLLVIN